MTLRDAFLQDILDNPEEDVVRLIYADWLDEQGDPRGEFIRTQIRLTESLTSLQADELRRQEQEMLRDHTMEWLGRGRFKLKRWYFRRGFVDEIQMQADSFLREGGELLEREPVRCVRLTWASRVIEALANSPLLSRLVELDLSFNYLNDLALAKLAASPHLGRLRALRLGHNYLRQGATALTGSALPALRLLDLSGNQLPVVARQPLVDRFGKVVQF